MSLRFIIALLLVPLLPAPASADEDAADYAPRFDKSRATPVKAAFCDPQDYFAFLLDPKQKAVARCGKFTIAMRGLPGHYRAEEHGDQFDVKAIELSLRAGGKQHRVSFAPDRIPSFLDGVFYGDFNGDGRLDFAVKLHDHGVGFGASFGDLLCLLSDRQGYRYVLFHHPVTEMKMHFVKLKGDRHTALLLPWHIAMDSTKTLDRKDHSFFVYDLLEFCASCEKGVRLANGRDPRFPFWVQNTWRESHKATRLVSGTQKKKSWGNSLAHAEFGRLE